MQAVWLCISSCRPFEDTFDKAHLRKVGQMQPMCRVWRVPATLPYPDFFFTTRTLPGIFLKISGFRVVSKYHFQCRIISMTLISRGKWPFTRLINFQNFPHPSDRKTFVTKWSMEFPQQLNTTIIIWRSAATSPDILVVGDDDGDTDTFDMQNTYWQSRLTLPATLPVTRIFSHYPTRTLPEVKKPYSSVSANVTMPPRIDVISLNIG